MNDLIDGCPKVGFSFDKEATIIIVEKYHLRNY
jgi:hypothetical protein